MRTAARGQGEEEQGHHARLLGRERSDLRRPPSDSGDSTKTLALFLTPTTRQAGEGTAATSPAAQPAGADHTPQTAPWAWAPARDGSLLGPACPCGPRRRGCRPCCRQSPSRSRGARRRRGCGGTAPGGKASFSSPEAAAGPQAAGPAPRAPRGPGAEGSRAALQAGFSQGGLAPEGDSTAVWRYLSVGTAETRTRSRYRQPAHSDHGITVNQCRLHWATAPATLSVSFQSLQEQRTGAACVHSPFTTVLCPEPSRCPAVLWLRSGHSRQQHAGLTALLSSCSILLPTSFSSVLSNNT